ncbi:PqqD family protein [Planktothrix paucivesiculata]|uniref:Pyrroloquinoline quinone biosynthesis protein PqqD n=1 Tax=Planktothrix paucivesiculata PCC 9631 TaxID=671071 RepID=A0A7Z9BX38_9CYAN|nr:PqqD family protein [Planktothrix paucivesiculata]VXD24269.1 conserved hypothetical protein [Planktothrix paucivesiculata PCC 9631]
MINPGEKFNANTPKVVHESIDGEVVVVNLEQGDYFSLVKVGADIWDGLIRGLSRGDIVSEIIQHYEGEHTVIENAVNNFIEQLQQEELIVVNTKDAVESQNNDKTQTIPNEEKLNFELPSLQKYTDMEELLALDPIHEVDEQIGWPSAKVEA